ncbi:uncharacterized protein Dana_GF17178 [Drosophila ananassae]|uniref:VM domain-containing protein n=1 Tax=Drosophila ananassae TaxID=7217 RepID=B3M0T9_DROAN|nr:postacrosomal sheath WW domain-binding protein [Drosophila ananassae]EDV42104.1 uncharacterized protein Dana_GF17178 [Drosophila ananassae]
MSVLQLVFLLVLAGSREALEAQMDSDLDESPGPEPVDGRSFFLLGTLFRRWRNRWMAYHNPDPIFAGPSYPVSGYYNCPVYGCNPAAIGPQPAYYAPPPGGFYTTPLNQQQQAQGNSNVYIYQSDQNSATGSNPLGYGYFGGGSPPPLGPPPPAKLPSSPTGVATASAGSYGLGPAGQRPGPLPIPLPFG